MQTSRRLRIGFLQKAVDKRLALFLCQPLKLFTISAIARSLVEDIPFQERLDVKPRAADDERQLAARGDAPDLLPREALKVHDVERRLGRKNVDEVMRHGGALFFRRLRRADVEAPIKEHRIARDDFRIKPSGKRKGKRGLADRRRPYEDDEPRLLHASSNVPPGSTICTAARVMPSVTSLYRPASCAMTGQVL